MLNKHRGELVGDPGAEQQRFETNKRQDRPAEVAVGPPNKRRPSVGRGLRHRQCPLVRFVLHPVGHEHLPLKIGPRAERFRVGSTDSLESYPARPAVDKLGPSYNSGIGLPEDVQVRVNIHAVESMPFAENTYLVWADGSAEAVVVDPGFEPDAVLEALRERQLTPVAVLNTHGHVDHIAGNKAMKQYFPDAPLVIGRGDAAMLTDPALNLSGPFGFDIVSPPADRLVDEGESFTYAGLTFGVLEIPGHSPGHVVYVLDGPDPKMVLGGDVLFAGSIGRTDFPNGSQTQLVAGIRAKLWPLPDATRVYPGHGPVTTIGEEKSGNPFVAGRAG